MRAGGRDRKLRQPRPTSISCSPTRRRLPPGSASAGSLIAMSLEIASVLPGAVGRGCATVASRISPLLVRRLVQAAIGVSVLAGPLTAGSAFAAGPSSRHLDISELDTGSPDRPAYSATRPPPSRYRSTGRTHWLRRCDRRALRRWHSTDPRRLSSRQPPPTAKWTSTGAAATRHWRSLTAKRQIRAVATAARRLRRSSRRHVVGHRRAPPRPRRNLRRHLSRMAGVVRREPRRHRR